jgi:hypothetical protein
MPNFVKVPKPLLNMKARLYAQQAAATKAAEPILKRAVANSVRLRWYKTGASLRAIGSESASSDGKGFAVVFSGQFYDVFGEYGTGRSGAEGAPAFTPAGWRYGSIPGMRARMAFHAGLSEALPGIMDVYRDKMRLWAKGL